MRGDGLVDTARYRKVYRDILEPAGWPCRW